MAAAKAAGKGGGGSRQPSPRRKKGSRRPTAGRPPALLVKAAALVEAVRSTRRSVLLVWVLAVISLSGLIAWSLGAVPRGLSPPGGVNRPQVSARSPAPDMGKPSSGKPRQPATAAGQPKPDHADAPPKPAAPGPPREASPPAPSGQPSSPAHAGDGKTLLAMHKPEAPPPPPVVPRPPEEPALPPIGRVAIVIDDFGDHLDLARRFLELPVPITISVLPGRPHSGEIARMAHERNREVILHLPMEPKGYPRTDPGEGALLLSMTDDRVESLVKTALDSSPYFAGVNNHMGSRFTEDPGKMKVVLGEVRRRGLYFLDSSTSPRSAALSTARDMQIPCGRRDIFLDHKPAESSVRSQVKVLLRRARVEGHATAIGHAREATLKVLREELKEFDKERVAVVPASDLVARNR